MNDKQINNLVEDIMKEDTSGTVSKWDIGYTEKEMLTEKFLKEIKKDFMVDVDIMIDEIVNDIKRYDQDQCKEFLNKLADLLYN
jgi:hypothetical protein